MSHRKRWTLGVFACMGVGIGAAGLAMLLMTTLDRALPGESLRAAPATGTHSMGQEATIGVFLALSIVLIVIALVANVVDSRTAKDSHRESRRTEVREIRTGRILVQRQ